MEDADELAVVVGVREVLVIFLVGVPQHGAHLGLGVGLGVGLGACLWLGLGVGNGVRVGVH